MSKVRAIFRRIVEKCPISHWKDVERERPSEGASWPSKLMRVTDSARECASTTHASIPSAAKAASTQIPNPPPSKDTPHADRAWFLRSHAPRCSEMHVPSDSAQVSVGPRHPQCARPQRQTSLLAPRRWSAARAQTLGLPATQPAVSRDRGDIRWG